MEYLLLFFEYIKIRVAFFAKSIAVSVVLYLCITKIMSYNDYLEYAESMHSNIVTVLGILLGFSISSLTILLTVDNKNIREAKNEPLGKKLYGKDVSLYDGVLIGMAHTVILQCFLLIYNLIYPLFEGIKTEQGFLLFAINISLLVHVIFCLMREILNFYFLITKNDGSTTNNSNSST